MCLVTFSIKEDPNYPFILMANRDEQYARSATPIQRWVDAPDVTAGIDLKEKGTWLGYTDEGKFITLLNYPFVDWEPDLETPRSRGQLLRDYLTKDISLAEFEDYLSQSRKLYNGYHLLYGTFDDLRYYSNVDGNRYRFESGIHCLANTRDDLSKHRLDRSSSLLENYLLEKSGKPDLSDLTKLMQDTSPSETLEDIPDQVDLDLAKTNSSVFIEGEEFGTVATTSLVVDKEGRLSIREVKYDQSGITEVTAKSHRLKIK